ncbi:SDR family oxidoreductase [Anditalea andensis]|uniref:Epimerase n=1 Tax=Anditalea andensis TaxID=1048983 RepID=A0A074KZB2_9BACT|nr:SDR family oxidoreductase [Anditalea andensis]KEO73545.1 epimerase [Anditalea andensis]
MKILLTGTTGYIGQRLLPVLLSEGHEVVCCVRDVNRFDVTKYESKKLTVIQVDFLKEDTLDNIPTDIEAAYYLIHSMSTTRGDYANMEKRSAENFVNQIQKTQVRQVIYLSGIINDEKLSKHLKSRKLVEEILSSGSFHTTTLRAAIILGSGSASFEIIRDLVEKLPVMVAPKWLNTRSQPIAIRNVVEFLKGVLGFEKAYDKNFDIGGPEILTYKQMLMGYAKARKLNRTIVTVPVMTPKLSSYWLYFVTSVSYPLASQLVKSMSVEVICEPNDLGNMLDINLLSYEEAIEAAFHRIQNEGVISSWKDALSRKNLHPGIHKLLDVPTYGCYVDKRIREVKNVEKALDKIWSIGGVTGWYYSNWLWRIRGFMDKMVGGVGLRRGRKNATMIYAGESLDFWRVLYANKDEKKLLLYAEMKLPGEAWLQFEIKNNMIYQTATFRPLGLLGRMYWYSVLPFHGFIFKGMLKEIAT